jgi:hypothetical protein
MSSLDKGFNPLDNINVEALKPIICDCGNDLFIQSSILRDIPVIQSPTGQRTLANIIMGYMCIACHNVVTFTVDAKTDQYVWKKKKEAS